MSASSMKQIKNRIKSISSTMKITKAMELVASSKLSGALERAENAKPYFMVLLETMEDIAWDNKNLASVYTRSRAGRTCRVVIAGDRGLAGGYNNNLFKSLKTEENDMIFPIGKKAAERFGGADVFSAAYTAVGDIKMSDCREMGELLAKAYERGDFTRLTISYTSYKSAIEQEPKTVNLLPIKSERGDTKNDGLIIYEPDAEELFGRLAPYYLSGVIYGAVSEAYASELSARRNAMEAATDNAAEIIDNLSLEYNRARQASITQELTEIIAGAGEKSQ